MTIEKRLEALEAAQNAQGMEIGRLRVRAAVLESTTITLLCQPGIDRDAVWAGIIRTTEGRGLSDAEERFAADVLMDLAAILGFARSQ